jgi:hypothetical protein
MAPKRDFLKENKRSVRTQPAKVSSAPPKIARVAIRNPNYCTKPTAPVQPNRKIQQQPRPQPPPKSLTPSCSSVSIQTADNINDDQFLNGVIIRYPSAHLMKQQVSPEPEEIPEIIEPASPEPRPPPTPLDDHSQKMDRKISDLAEYLEKGSISTKRQPSKESLRSSKSRSCCSLKAAESEHFDQNSCSEDDYKPDNRVYRRQDLSPSRSFASSKSSYAESVRSKKSIGKPESVISHVPSNYKLGEVPKYLRERKDQQRQEELREMARDPNCPVGHIALSDEERLEALSMAKTGEF